MANVDPLEQIGLGAAGDDGTGDSLRVGGEKTNRTTEELGDVLALLGIDVTSTDWGTFTTDRITDNTPTLTGILEQLGQSTEVDDLTLWAPGEDVVQDVTERIALDPADDISKIWLAKATRTTGADFDAAEAVIANWEAVGVVPPAQTAVYKYRELATPLNITYAVFNMESDVPLYITNGSNQDITITYPSDGRGFVEYLGDTRAETGGNVFTIKRGTTIVTAHQASNNTQNTIVIQRPNDLHIRNYNSADPLRGNTEYRVDATAGPEVIDASTATNGDDLRLRFTKFDVSANTVTVNGAITGDYVLTKIGESVTLLFVTGEGWTLVESNLPATSNANYIEPVLTGALAGTLVEDYDSVHLVRDDMNAAVGGNFELFTFDPPTDGNGDPVDSAEFFIETQADNVGSWTLEDSFGVQFELPDGSNRAGTMSLEAGKIYGIRLSSAATAWVYREVLSSPEAAPTFRGTITADPAPLLSNSRYNLDASAAGFALDLSAVVAPVEGDLIILHKVDNTANDVSVTGANRAVSIESQGSKWTFEYDGTNWLATPAGTSIALSSISRGGPSNPGNGNPFQQGTEHYQKGSISYANGVYTIGKDGVYDIDAAILVINGAGAGNVVGVIRVNGVDSGIPGALLTNDAAVNFPGGGNSFGSLALTAGDEVTFVQTGTVGFGGTNKITSVRIKENPLYVPAGTHILEQQDDILAEQVVGGGGTLAWATADLSLYEYLRFEFAPRTSANQSYPLLSQVKVSDLDSDTKQIWFSDNVTALSATLAADGLSATFSYNGSFTTAGNMRVIGQRKRYNVIRAEDAPVSDQTDSGYFDIGNMRMQWGGGVGATPLVFPAPFASTNYRITANATSGTRIVRFPTKSTTGVNGVETMTHTGSFTSANYDWIAIGEAPNV